MHILGFGMLIQIIKILKFLYNFYNLFLFEILYLIIFFNIMSEYKEINGYNTRYTMGRSNLSTLYKVVKDKKYYMM